MNQVESADELRKQRSDAEIAVDRLRPEVHSRIRQLPPETAYWVQPSTNVGGGSEVPEAPDSNGSGPFLVIKEAKRAAPRCAPMPIASGASARSAPWARR